MIIEEYILFVSSLRNDRKFTKRKLKFTKRKLKYTKRKLEFTKRKFKFTKIKFKICTWTNTGDADEVDRADPVAVNNSVMEKKKI